MTIREVLGCSAESCGVEVSPGVISNVTGAVMAEVDRWQVRPLGPK